LIFTSKIKFALIILLTIFIIGTIGFHLIEGWSLIDSFYTTIATLSTVGYGDFAPETTAGKFFTIFVIIFGVGMMFYTLVLSAETFIEGRLRYLLGRGKLEKIIEKMNNHYIICGGGRIGFLICRELMAGKIPCLVIDNNPDVIQKAQDESFIYCKGDATQDKVLIAAGIKRAKGIICVLPSDAENGPFRGRRIGTQATAGGSGQGHVSLHTGRCPDGHGNYASGHAGFYRNYHQPAEPGTAHGRNLHMQRLAVYFQNTGRFGNT
jgi:voltage-gated potassium channel Kch